MSRMSKKLGSRSSRVLIQLTALVLVITGVVILALAESTTMEIAAALAISLVSLGATKLAIVSLVASNHSSSRLERDSRSISLRRRQVEIKQTVGALNERVDQLGIQIDRLSKLIEPSATLIELKEQELVALRERLALQGDLPLTSRSMNSSHGDSSKSDHVV